MSTIKWWVTFFQLKSIRFGYNGGTHWTWQDRFFLMKIFLWHTTWESVHLKSSRIAKSSLWPLKGQRIYCGMNFHRLETTSLGNMQGALYTHTHLYGGLGWWRVGPTKSKRYSRSVYRTRTKLLIHKIHSILLGTHQNLRQQTLPCPSLGWWERPKAAPE